MRPIARWNPARDVWEVPNSEGLLCEHLDVFSETFPVSGMTVAGTAYVLPTSEPLTDDSATSSLLPTPDASPEKYRLQGDSQQSRSLPAMAIRGELSCPPREPRTAPRADRASADQAAT